MRRQSAESAAVPVGRLLVLTVVPFTRLGSEFMPPVEPLWREGQLRRGRFPVYVDEAGTVESTSRLTEAHGLSASRG